jgi:polyribonucleotide nucleotidyltransferase
MDAVLNGPRDIKSKYAPQIRTLQIPTDKIRDLIGPGGKTIRGIIEATQVKIDVDDTGRVNVASSDEESLKKALGMINDLTAVPEIGKTYLGKVVRLAEFGAFVEIFPGTDGLLHVSEIAEHRVKDVKDELREGDQVLVKVLGVEGNRIKLSRKALLREQRQKMGLPEPGAQGAPAGDISASGESAPTEERPRRQPRPEPAERQPASNASTITIEGGDDFDDAAEEGEELNFNRADGVPVPVGGGGGERRHGQGGGGGQRRRRRGRGRGPGGGGGGRGPQ